MSPFLCLRQLLESRLDRAAIKWFKEASAEIGDQVSGARFCALLSRASRAVKRRPLELTPKDRAQVAKVIDGWNPEYWNLLEAVRAALVLSRPDLALEGGGLAIEEAFKYGDEGELCALYRSIIILPDPERFVWRVGEGCRSNMRTLFEAAALDTPYPARFFDELTWNQLVMKGIFIGAPMWRLWGLDGRQSPELARMALDLAEERRSAGRAVQHELWLCLGQHAGERGLEALRLELDPTNSNTLGRRGAAYGLARAGARAELEDYLSRESDESVQAALEDALEGNTQSSVFEHLTA
ncbi:MAG: hypothetical protein CMJ89_12645 [Planctomycetes bacterium]|jgi:hypothetical protein|nr:hypothetical protein [Planctomycetota bacterium]